MHILLLKMYTVGLWIYIVSMFVSEEVATKSAYVDFFSSKPTVF